MEQDAGVRLPEKALLIGQIHDKRAGRSEWAQDAQPVEGLQLSGEAACRGPHDVICFACIILEGQILRTQKESPPQL